MTSAAKKRIAFSKPRRKGGVFNFRAVFGRLLSRFMQLFAFLPFGPGNQLLDFGLRKGGLPKKFKQIAALPFGQPHDAKKVGRTKLFWHSTYW